MEKSMWIKKKSDTENNIIEIIYEVNSGYNGFIKHINFQILSYYTFINIIKNAHI